MICSFPFPLLLWINLLWHKASWNKEVELMSLVESRVEPTQKLVRFHISRRNKCFWHVSKSLSLWLQIIVINTPTPTKFLNPAPAPIQKIQLRQKWPNSGSDSAAWSPLSSDVKASSEWRINRMTNDRLTEGRMMDRMTDWSNDAQLPNGGLTVLQSQNSRSDTDSILLTLNQA